MAVSHGPKTKATGSTWLTSEPRGKSKIVRNGLLCFCHTAFILPEKQASRSYKAGPIASLQPAFQFLYLPYEIPLIPK